MQCVVQRSSVSALDKWLCFALGKLESKCQSSVLHWNRLFFPKGNSSVTGFYFVVPKQNCSHIVKQANILAFPSWLRMEGNVFGLSVGWMQFPTSLQQEHTPCQEASISPGNVSLLLSARLIQPVSFKMCGNELQSHHSCGGFSEEIAEGSQHLWKSPFR